MTRTSLVAPSRAPSVRPGAEQRRPRGARGDAAAAPRPHGSRPARDPRAGGHAAARHLPRVRRARTAAAGHRYLRDGDRPGEPARAGRHGDRRRVRVLRPAHRRDCSPLRRAMWSRWRPTGASTCRTALVDALDQHPDARLLAVVHAETSTGVEHPLAELGAAMRGSDTLLMADCVTSLGGVELDFDGWGIDYAYSCTQKCLGAPPGMSPVAVSERAIECVARPEASRAVLARLDVCSCGTGASGPPSTTTPRRSSRSTRSTRPCARSPPEGLEARWQRHRRRPGPGERGGRARLPAVRGARPPARAAHRAPRPRWRGRQRRSRQRCSWTTASRSAVGLGPATPPIWRVGLDGPERD